MKPVQLDSAALADVVEKVTQCLSDGNWKLARQIHKETGVLHRDLRFAIEYTGFLISGQSGYKLTALATKQERDQARATLMSYANKILRRAEALA